MDEITRSQGEETSLQEMAPGVEVVATPKWYELVDLEKSEKFIRANLKNEAMNVIATGYYLKHIKERGFFLEAGYKDFYDYAKAELGFSRSAASRYMSKNSRFSKDGNSPLVAEQYKDYSRSQLQEMLSLDDAELEQVTPEMTVRQIRELRRQKETPVPYIELPGQMSIEDFPGIAEEDAGLAEESRPERIPEKQDFMLDVGDLLPEEDAAKAQQNPEIRCENGSEEEGEPVATSQRQMEPRIRDAYCDAAARKFIEAFHDWMQADFPNRVMNVTESETQFKERFRISGATWYFEAPDGTGAAHVNLFDDYVQFWSGKIGECIGNCEWFYLCAAVQRMWNVIALEKAEAERNSPEIPEKVPETEENVQEMPISEPEPTIDDIDLSAVDAEFNEVPAAEYDSRILNKMIADAENTLGVMQEYWRENQPQTYTKHVMELQAYKDLLVRHENAEEEPEPVEQPELPLLKNNDQRKEWLNAFHDWPVWFKVPEASETFYRYDFEDGSSFVICEYRYYAAWREKFKYGELGPESVGTRDYILNPGYHYLHDCLSNRTLMIDKLKETQKKG